MSGEETYEFVGALLVALKDSTARLRRGLGGADPRQADCP
jgi:hypothetical protein